MAEKHPIRTLGEQESYLLSSLSAAGRAVFTVEDARAVMNDSAANIRKLLHRLHR